VKANIHFPVDWVLLRGCRTHVDRCHCADPQARPQAPDRTA
jgi:hypothetical protein